jgi:hypothetical protein
MIHDIGKYHQKWKAQVQWMPADLSTQGNTDPMVRVLEKRRKRKTEGPVACFVLEWGI